MDGLAWQLTGTARPERLTAEDYEALTAPLYELMYEIANLPDGIEITYGDADRDIQMATNAGVTKTIRIESENPHHINATCTLPDTRGLAELLRTLL